jgi:hypothetical protein
MLSRLRGKTVGEEGNFDNATAPEYTKLQEVCDLSVCKGAPIQSERSYIFMKKWMRRHKLWTELAAQNEHLVRFRS